MLAKRKKQGRSVLYIIAPLSHSLAEEGGTESGQVRGVGAGGQKESFWGTGIWGGGGKSSWPPRVASFCWVARLALTQSWSRTHRQRQTLRSLYGLCTSCYQKSSLSGAGCSPWPSPVHELWQYRGKKKKTQTKY